MASVKGAPELQRRIRAVGKAPEGMLKAWQIRAVQLAKIKAPKQTGNLKRSIRPGVLSARSATIQAGGSGGRGANQFGAYRTDVVNYASYVEYGTRPHIIRPRVKKVLAWGGARRLSGNLRSGARATHFARLVNHPGTQPRPYMAPAAEQAQREIGVGGIIKAWNEGA